MSIVAVHGPYTFGSKAIVSNAVMTATVTPANGLSWTFTPKDQSQVAANYDWTWTPTHASDAPASPLNNTKNPTIVFGNAGTKTVTLTLNGVAQPTIQVTAVAGAAPQMMLMDEEGGSGEAPTETPSPVEPSPETPYDPGAHTIAEVQEYVGQHPDEVDEIYSAEEAGKARVTLLDWLATQA